MGGSLDSLLDTMTNVVGILVILLIVTQLNVSEKVREIRELLPEVSVEQLVLLKKDLNHLNASLQSLGAEGSHPDSLINELKLKKNKLSSQVVQLKDEISKIPTIKKGVLLTHDDLKKSETLLKNKQGAAEKSMKTIRSIESQLSKGVTKMKGLPTKVVKLPDPRLAPKGAKALLFLCTNNRVYYVDQERLRKTFASMIQARRFKEDKDGNIDPEQVKSYFSRRKKGDKFFNVNMNQLNGHYHSKNLMTIEAKKNQGSSSKSMNAGLSSFEKMIKNIVSENKKSLKEKGHEKWYIRFFVSSNSFEAYLSARQISDKHKLAAGWVPYGHTGFMHIHNGMNLQLKGYIPPKPRPKPVNPPVNKPRPPVGDVID